METRNTIIAVAVLIFTTTFAKAQNPTTTLQHAGTTQIFYGKNSYVDAYKASVNGDTLLLSAGNFNPTDIAKRLTIIGAGHYPDSTTVVLRRTNIIGAFFIIQGADSLHLEGLCIINTYYNNNPGSGISSYGDIRFDQNSTFNNIDIFRCNVQSIDFSYYGSDLSRNNCIIRENIIRSSIAFKNGVNLIVKNNIILGGIYDITQSAIISNNIIFGGVQASSCFIENNIIPYISGQSNLIRNNIFTSTISQGVDINNNSFLNNFSNISQSTIFVNQSGTNFDYAQDYHLQNQATYIGTDGTQVGIYGGANPFKVNFAPTNPQVLKKKVTEQTDAQGNIKIDFTVKAQDN